MKKTISIIVLVAMLLSTVLAVIPMSAAEVEKNNVLFSDADAANYQFAGNGNVFYYDYHYYVDTLNAFPMTNTNKGPSLRVGNNSGSGTASATDGKRFAGSMSHSYSDDCAKLTLDNGSTVTHDHVFGYSFKEAVTIDSFKLYATAGKDNRDDISRVTVYGASVDPSVKYDSYESGKYYYTSVTQLYSMAEGANVQDVKETEDGVTAAVVSGDFAAPATVDYILFGLDFDTISAKKYTVLEAEAYGEIVVEDDEEDKDEEEEVVDIDALLPLVHNEKVDFANLTYKTLYKGAESDKVFADNFKVEFNGNSFTSAPVGNPSELGYVAQTEYAITEDSFYVYEFKAKLNRNGGYAGIPFAINGLDHYFVYGGFGNDGDYFDAEGNRVSHIQMRKGYKDDSTARSFYEAVNIPALLDEEGYGYWRIVYEGLTVSVQFMNADGEWEFVANSRKAYKTNEGAAGSQQGGDDWYANAPAVSTFTLPPEGSFVAVGLHNRNGDAGSQRTVNIKDAVIYDLNTPNTPDTPEAPSFEDFMKLASEKGVDFANLTFKTLFAGKESEKNFAEEYTVTIDGNALNTVANEKTSPDKPDNLGYVAQTEYAITADSYYVYELKAKLNRDTGYAGFVIAANGTEHYFAGGAFANDGDHDNADGTRASHIVLYKGEWDQPLDDDGDFGDHFPVPTAVKDGYGSWRVIYEGLTVKVQYVAKDGNWTYVTNDNGSVASTVLPEGFFVAVGAHNRGGDVNKQRTINIKDAVIYDLNTPAFDKLVKYAAEESVDFANLTFKTLFAGKESEKNFAEEYTVTIDGNALNTVANEKTSPDKPDNLGYVAQTEYAITADSYYVYELKAKLNRDTGYAGFVIAANGTEHYFAGGAFANDGDHDNADGTRASHIVLYKGEWDQPLDDDGDFGDHFPVPTAVKDGYGSWRVIYEGLTVKVQYVAKDGNWTYVTNDNGSVASTVLPEGFFVAVGAHNRGGDVNKQRTINIKDAVIYDLNNIDLNKGVGPAISTPEEFVQALAQGGDFYLTNDIVLPEGYVPANFSGTLDGKGFTVVVKNTGVFATLANATVKNLNIAGSVESEASLGVLADRAEGTVTVEGVTVALDVLKGNEVAAFIRLTNAAGAVVTLKDCKNLTNIVATGKAAAFVAYSNGVTLTIDGCQNLASVTGGNDTAGFVADVENSELLINDSVNGILGVTKVEGINACGGFVGEGSGNVTITNSTNYSLIFDNGTSDWDSTAGGILGMFGNRGSGSAFVAKGVKNYGDLKTRDQWYQGAGGIVGSAKWRDDTKLYFEDTINYGSCVKTGTGPNLGGFVGFTDNGNPIEFIFKNCQNYGDFRSNGNNSGFVGQAGSKNTYFENCQNYGDIRSHNNMAGGFVAWQKHTAITLKDCANYGTIVANSKYASGLVSGPDCSNVNVDNCANYGRLIGAQRAVGIVYAEGGTVTNCANYGALSVTKADGKVYAFGNSKMTIDEATCKDEGVLGYTEVANVEDFMAMKAGGLYVLTANIVLPADYAGIDLVSDKYYPTEIDGNGYTVTLKSEGAGSVFNTLGNAKIYDINFKGEASYTEADGFVASKVVSGVAFENVNVEAYLTGTSNVGGYVGETDAAVEALTFKNCTFVGSIYTADKAAAFVAQLTMNNGDVSFENCSVGSKYVDTTIVGKNRVAAFVAKIEAIDTNSDVALTFKNCSNYADVAAVQGSASACVGAFVARAKKINITMDKCYNYGDMSADTTSSGRGVGGFIGDINRYSNAVITSSANYGDISVVTSAAGGFVGTVSNYAYVTFGALNADGSVNADKACYNYGDIEQTKGWAYGAGGFVGYIYDGSKSDMVPEGAQGNSLYAYGAVNNGNITTICANIGGILGMTHDTWKNIAEVVVIGCVNNGDLTNLGDNNVSGILGQTPGYEIKAINCVNNGHLSSGPNGGESAAILAAAYAGQNILIDGCVNNGVIESEKWLGGIASSVRDPKSVTITNCVNNGIVVARNLSTSGASGIASSIDNCIIANCVNNAIVAANEVNLIARDVRSDGANYKNENNTAGGAKVTADALHEKALTLGGVVDYTDEVAYAAVVKAFADAQAAISNPAVEVVEQKVTAEELFAAVTTNSYAGHNGTHELGGVTFETYQVMTSNQTSSLNALQFQKDVATLTAKNVTVKTLTIEVLSTYDYTAHPTITVGGTAIALPTVEEVNATGVKTGVNNNSGYEYTKYVLTVTLDAAVTGDLLIANTCKNASTNKGYAIYVASITIGSEKAVESADPTAAVDAAIATLVNVDALNDALLAADVLAAKGYAEADYTAESWAAYAAALEAAKAVDLKDQAAIDAAVKALNDAEAALVFVGALNYQLARAAALEAVNYTKSTWAALVEVVAQANAVDLKDQTAIDAAAAAVNAAIYDLGDISAVADLTKTAIENAKKYVEAEYSAKSWAVLAEAIANAEAALTSGDAELMDSAIAAIEAAIAQLIRVAELNAALDAALALVADNYTASSMSALQIAIEAAQKALASENQTIVDNALATLNDAVAGLVDVTELKALVAEVEALNKDDYTVDSWLDVSLALSHANLALSFGDVEFVAEALAELTAAKAALVVYVPVDYSALKAAVEEAATLVRDEYTAETWATFAEALAAAKLAIYADNQADVDAAVAALAAAKAALVVYVPVDYAALDAAIAEVEALVEAAYTAESWAALATALEAAKAALKAEAQADVDAAVAALVAAKDALVEVEVVPVDYAALKAAIAEVEALVEADYTAESWAALATALEAAKAALEAEAQADVDAAVAALAAAKDALVKAEVAVDYAALNAAIAEVEALVEADYTAESWAALATALEAAKAALEAEAQADVDAAVAALTAAKDALVEAEKQPDDNDQKPGDDDQKPGDDEQKPGDDEQPTDKPTDKPTEKPTDKATEKPTDKATEQPTEAPAQSGCNGVIGATAVVLTAVLGLGVTVVLKKKED